MMHIYYLIKFSILAFLWTEENINHFLSSSKTISDMKQLLFDLLLFILNFHNMATLALQQI